MKRFSAVASGLACLAVLGGCENPPFEPVPSHFLASVEGSVRTEYQGSSRFDSTTRLRPAAPPRFMIQSRGHGPSRGQQFEIMRGGAAPLETGVHELGADFFVVYRRPEGKGTGQYLARVGEVEVVHSSAERIEGTFRFTAVKVHDCVTSGANNICTPVSADDPPRVEVTGSFEAVPARGRW